MHDRFGLSRAQLARFVESWRQGVAVAPASRRREREREEMEDGLEAEEEERPSKRRRIEMVEEEGNVGPLVTAPRTWAQIAAQTLH